MKTNKEKFNIFGSNYTIEYKPKVFTDDDLHWVWGQTDLQKHIISISTQLEDDKPVTKEEIALTRLHEIVHAIFSTGQYNQANTDEPLVEWTARCIYSLLKQGILKYNNH